MVTFSITDEDRGWSRTVASLRTVDGVTAEAGLFAAEQVVKGASHEFGTDTLPSRPWLAPSTDGATDRMLSMAAREFGQVADGRRSGKVTVRSLGTLMRDAARDYIRGGKVQGPPVSPSWAARKSGTTLLVDTGAMVDSIDVEVSGGST